MTALAFAALYAAPAFAQDQGATTQSTDPTKQDQATSNAPQAGTNAAAVPVENANAGSSNEEIVITGTIFRRTNTETPSPVTVLSSESLARRGITNVSDAVRSVSADSSGSIPNAFAAGFGAGASAPSLRGLTVNSTLTLVDGQRVTNYPLSDDGQRSFVDLNTMPRVSIERVEVLKDGASSTYGADAIGGVVNVVQRKIFNGLDATLEGGTSQHGGGTQYRGSVLAGWGDYANRGLNFYVGAEYELNKKIYARDRGFPFNTNDLTSLTGGENLNADLNDSGITPTAAIVRPATQLFNNDLLQAIPGSGFVLLNPAQCAQIGGTITNGSAGESCTENLVANYGEIQPKTERYGIVAHGAVRLSDDIEAYMNLSWYRNNLVAGGNPQALRTTSPIQTSTFVLPNWICSAGVNCDTAADRQLNPYNPFASATGNPLNNAAQLYYRFGERDGFNRNGGFRNEVLRGAIGVSGDFLDGFHFNVDATASQSRLRLTSDVVSLSGFTQAIATGQYNLIDPTLNSQAVRDSVILHNDYTATSALYAIQGVVTKDLFTLPSGHALQLGVGAHFRHESLDNPNGNPTADFIAFNQASAKGERDVEAAFFELNAPILKQLEVNLSG
ncbi:MAG: TonB-dependent receptor plug domain-containing protein, partial [Sphingomonas sp.]|nr:TonB-dependent receptor plug domain-containing protein [Sphingomonas sp.]